MRSVVLWGAALCTMLLACAKAEIRADNPEPDMDINLNKSVLLNKVNEIRASGCKCGQTTMPPVAPLKWNDLLASAALNHSKDMLRNNFFDHTSADGRTLGTRITQAGYVWSAVGENIALGQRNETEVFNSWLNSEGHCKNMMSAKFKEMGAGRAGNYWTQDFGSPR
ncbi:CAP domain-containing protein [Pedobacter sp. SYP-B3415]|uniref:CAP domain-containing protein n=1 Tax=Pedobacter sp. SYP-B3415 TaxID=2496641 RepID=UPI00101D8D17|nr:CAP domain-containing protein [Pedobacter sp. SYP-B3415]